MSRLRLIPTLVTKIILVTFHYMFSVLYRIDNKKVTFASYRSEELKDNLLYIHDEVDKQYPSYEKKLLFYKLDSSVLGKLKYTIHMISACYHLATSKYFIIDDYYIPLYMINRRKGVQVIQLWHCSGALKQFGRSTVGKPFGPSKLYLKHVNVHGNYSKAYVSNTSVIPFFAEAFNMSEESILPCGNPRTDYLYDKVTHAAFLSDVYKQQPEWKNKKIILYAPTFRGKSHYQDEFVSPFNMKQMEKALADNYVLLIQLHPYMRSEFHIPEELKDFTMITTGEYTIQELFVLSDILITDYSTVFFDYSILNKPMIFFPYDLQEYIADRDFYYDYEGLVPGPLVTDTKSLIEVITRDKYDFDQIEAFRDTFFDYQDGKASERIVHNIFEN